MDTHRLPGTTYSETNMWDHKFIYIKLEQKTICKILDVTDL